MKAEIISIGSELTLGQTVDTNAAWLGQRLAAAGVACGRHVTVADDQRDIVAAITEAAGRAELVLVTGGLGPTPDDVTRESLAEAMGVELELHADSLVQIEEYFRQRGRSMHEANRRQAMIPRGARAIANTCGTAPGVHARWRGVEVYVLPGVPAEMRAMFEGAVAPGLPAGGGVILQHELQSFGMSEAEIGQRIADLMARGREPAVGTSAAELIITIRINARGADEASARRALEADAVVVRERLGQAVFGEGGETLQGAVGTLLKRLGGTVSTAESCTGGLIAKRLTDVPGSSAYLVQGFVTYSNEAKSRLLGVPPELIAAHGAVSAEVAEAMAGACRRLSGTDFALSATGIAGPAGGTAAKPVGLVYVGLADGERATVRELRLGESLTREQVRDRTAKAALNLLRLRLLGTA
jgi:nicotinamide-nucleotide amidase